MTTTATAPVTNQPAPKTQIDTVIAQRIHDLRTAGLIIQSEIVTHNDKRFSVYWLDEQTLLESELSSSEVNP